MQHHRPAQLLLQYRVYFKCREASTAVCLHCTGSSCFTGMGRQLQDSRMPNSSSVCLAQKSLVLPHSRVLPPLLSGDCKRERTMHFENTCFDIYIYVLCIYVHTHTHNVYHLFMCARTQAHKHTHTQTQKDTHIRARYSYEETLTEVVLEDRTVAVKSLRL
mmetsp:Transcript_74305/g.120696  ORF Transcript_74305/g.120696 Transcript_74305/m.120696 type:complete len:161 (+) Transcript_74305:2149-2631(+)